MGFYERHVLPRFIDFSMRQEQISDQRKRVTAGLAGEVLEIGFGSGLNMPFLPPAVTRVLAVDPSDVARKMARKAIAQRGLPVDFVGLDGQQLSLADASADAALSTFTLCTIPDPHAALCEVRRVLRPGGVLHFLEHGKCADASVARWQDRLNPIQQKVCGGCNLNRAMDVLVRDAGFELLSLETFFLKAPRPFGYVYLGTARAA